MGLITSDEEIKTNLIPFDLNIYCYEEPQRLTRRNTVINSSQEEPYKKLKRVTVKIPNDILLTTDSDKFSHFVRPLSYDVLGKDILSCGIFVQANHKASKPHLVYSTSWTELDKGISYVMLR